MSRQLRGLQPIPDHLSRSIGVEIATVFPDAGTPHSLTLDERCTRALQAVRDRARALLGAGGAPIGLTEAVNQGGARRVIANYRD